LEEDQLIPISALQHYAYCPRQCALIHIEQVFVDNIWTAKGKWSHERVDEEHVLSSKGYTITTSLRVWSERLGLTSICDVVEWHGDTPYPVEFKHGPRKGHLWDDTQLCAQAMCLEDMCGVPVPEGAIYHVSSRHRRVVTFTPELRAKVEEMVQAVRALYTAEALPPAVHDQRCTHCSLQDVCMPEWTDGTAPRSWYDVLAQVGEDIG
jgi:CRISPR-associated exonuclease Cas4